MLQALFTKQAFCHWNPGSAPTGSGWSAIFGPASDKWPNADFKSQIWNFRFEIARCDRRTRHGEQIPSLEFGILELKRGKFHIPDNTWNTGAVPRA